MRSRLSLLLLSFFIPFLLSAQAHYKSGFVVTQPGDTLKGFINYREWNNNPKEIEFKTSLDAANHQTYTPQDLKSFNIDGYDLYEAFAVPVSMNKVNYREIIDANDTAAVTSTVFLKTLLKGDRVNLYLYRDKIKERFYLLDKEATVPVELKYQVQVKVGAVVDVPIFQQQLNNIAIKYQLYALSQPIQAIAYSKADLLKIARQLNTTHEADFSSKLTKKSKVRFFVGAGINYTVLRYGGENLITVDGMTNSGFDKFKEKVITHSYLPRISAGADIYINPELQRLVLRGEISAASTKSETVAIMRYNSFSDKEQQNTYNFSLITISVAPQVIYNLYHNQGFKLYLGTGAAFNYYLNNKNVLNRRPAGTDESFTEEEIINYVEMKSIGLNLLVRSGIVFRNKIELGLIYINPSRLDNYSKFREGGTVRAQSLALTLNYLFR